jgi:hypothetical protein
MGFDKVVEARLWGVTLQNTDLRTTMGDSSGGTFTRRDNRLRGTLFWDEAEYVLQNVSVAGGATGGSYTVTIETDAVVGYTGLPIARATLGPDSPTTVIMDNLHQSKGSPLPTHMFIDQTAAGAMTLTCGVIAKQYRGTFGTAVSKTAERVLQGTMLIGGAAGPFSDSRGFTEDATMTLGTSGSDLGMKRLRLWDNAMYWGIAGVSITGSHDVDVVGSVDGATTSIATTGTGGAIDTAGEKVALASNFYGSSPNPSQIIWTNVTGGVSDARIVMIAKSGRGGLAKR